MKTPTLHETLQSKLGCYDAGHLVTTLRYQDQYGNTVEKPLFDATLDEVAFSIHTYRIESKKMDRRRSALESLYALARDHGCVGSKTVGDIAVEVTK